jgi:hypothetical protein
VSERVDAADRVFTTLLQEYPCQQFDSEPDREEFRRCLRDEHRSRGPS